MPYTAKQKQAYWAQRNALSTKEKALISFYEIQWHLMKKVPAVSEVTQHLKKKFPTTTQTEVNYFLTRRPVTKALEDRGVKWQQHSQKDLTEAQIAAAITVMNFADVRSSKEKLDQLGVNPSQYDAWLKDPQFKNLVDSLADQNLANIRPAAIGEFTKLINKGDWNAIKYWFETTGELQKQEGPDVEFILKAFVEIIQKHVKDPDTINAIAEELQRVTSNRTLEAAANNMLEANVINAESYDVQTNLKTLGY